MPKERLESRGQGETMVGRTKVGERGIEIRLTMVSLKKKKKKGGSKTGTEEWG